jgi:hypothetical protein
MYFWTVALGLLGLTTTAPSSWHVNRALPNTGGRTVLARAGAVFWADADVLPKRADLLPGCCGQQAAGERMAFHRAVDARAQMCRIERIV